MIDRPSDEKREELVQEILALVAEHELSGEQAETVLLRCLSFIRDERRVDEVAKEIGLSLSGFRTDGVLELYYDIRWKDKDTGYISKGWEDPGFRIGDVIDLDYAGIEMFRRNSDKILNTCATQGVACGVNLIEGDKLELDLSICIYQEGFNAGTVRAALETFDLCVNRAKSFLSG